MALKINMLGLEEHQVKIVADARQYSAADLLIKEATKMRDQLRKENEDTPGRCDTDLTEDFVFKAGAIHALNAIINAPEQADAYIKKRSK